MLFPLWGQAVYPLWCPSLNKDMKTELLLCWSGMTQGIVHLVQTKKLNESLSHQITSKLALQQCSATITGISFTSDFDLENQIQITKKILKIMSISAGTAHRKIS